VSIDWRRRLWLLPVVPIVVLAVAMIANDVLKLEPVAAFVAQYPGVVPLPSDAPTGFPIWLNATHFLNILFMALIARTALSIRSKQRPPHFFTRRNSGLIRTAGTPRRMSIHVWLHLSVDVLWSVNGVVFIVLLFATGQWMRIVPTSWDIFPNALSAGLQYLGFVWPTENAWVTYNSLQVLAYFVTVFIAAPVAILTGIRLSNAWPQRERWVRAIPEKPIRWIHNATLVYFAAFVVVHVFLVLTTGLLHNLNMMFAANDGTSWVGLVVCVLGLDVIMAIWMILRPKTVAAIARAFGKVH
jgi:thiosulfate reductase cytochrome b subunit